MSFTQKLWTTYHGYPDGDTRIGEKNRIWYSSASNTLRVQLDNTPGGTIIGRGAGGFIDYGDLSITADGAATGGGHLAYNNANGQFTYSPADLSSFATTSYVNGLKDRIISSDNSYATYIDNTGATYSAGDIIPGTNISNLGSISQPWKDVYVSKGSIVIADNDINVDGVSISNTDKYIVIDRGGLKVTANDETHEVFQLDNTGKLILKSLQPALTTTAAVDLIGNLLGTTLPTNNLGVMLHATGTQDQPSRIYLDGIGTQDSGQSAYAAYIGRYARGTVESPLPAEAGDILARFGGNAHSATLGLNTISNVRVDMVATEQQTDTGRGSRMEFWTTPIGSIVPQRSAHLDSGGIDFSEATDTNAGVTFKNGSLLKYWPDVTNNNGKILRTDGTDFFWDNETVVAGQVLFKGEWDASGNTPTLSTTLPTGVTTGWQYIVGVAGTQNINGTGNVTYGVGDQLIYNGATWIRIPAPTAQIQSDWTETNSALPAYIKHKPTLATVATSGSWNDLGDQPYIPPAQVNADWTATSGIAKITNRPADTAADTANTLVLRDSVGGINAKDFTATVDAAASSDHGPFNYGTLSYTDTGIMADFSYNINSYNQVILQNRNSLSSASTNYIVSNNLGTATTYYGEFGMNSSTFSGSGSLSLPSAVYLNSISSDLVLGGSALHFVIAGGATDALTINSSGVAVFANTISGSITGNSATADKVNHTVTFAATGGAAAGTAFDGSAARIIDYHTVGAQVAGTYVTSVTGTSPISVTSGTTPQVSISQANSTTNGYLSSADWTVFNNKSNTNGTVTSVAAITLTTTGTDITSTVATGTTTPVITLNVPTASASNRGLLSSADWTTFNNKSNTVGTVTSIATAGTVSGLTLTGGTITSSGTITLGGTLSLTSGNVTTALGFTPYSNANPSGYTTNTGTVTSITASTTPVNGLSLSGGAISTSGTIAITGTLSGITNTNLSGTAGITNANLANSSVTVTAGTGMSGGGAVSLGGSITLTNAGVTSIVAGTNVTVSGATGAVTINASAGVGGNQLVFVLDAVLTLASAKNTLASIFGLTNGVTVTSNTRYQYELVFNVQANKTGVLSYALALGSSAAVAQHNYTFEGNTTTTISGYTAGVSMMSLNATGAAITTAQTVADTLNGFAHYIVCGTIDVTTGGTVNFMISQDQITPITWSVKPGAYIKLTPLGAIGANTAAGTWA